MSNLHQASITQVFFHALPIGETFCWQDELFCKSDDDKAWDSDGHEWIIEPQYGCIILFNRAEQLDLKPSDFRPIEDLTDLI